MSLQKCTLNPDCTGELQTTAEEHASALPAFTTQVLSHDHIKKRVAPEIVTAQRIYSLYTCAASSRTIIFSQFATRAAERI
jgi:hypothetical protein